MLTNKTEKLYKLKLHETYEGEGLQATRVPGGWIYRFWNNESQEYYANCVFVPFEKLQDIEWHMEYNWIEQLLCIVNPHEKTVPLCRDKKR